MKIQLSYSINYRLVVSISWLVILTLWATPLAQAGGGPPQLPPRNPPPTTPQPAEQTPDNDDNEKPPVAYIELSAPFVSSNAWTTVQWQNEAGQWHKVAGWQGAFDRPYEKTWAVEVKDFGSQSFRWVVYDGKAGQLVAVSKVFDLPRGAHEVVRVEAVISP